MKERILIIEDDSILRSEISIILLMEGYDVIQAENGKIGIETAVEKAPDLILCDIMMPEMDGLGVLSCIRKLELTRLIPFIFITALAERENVRSGMVLGADDYLVKPFTRQEMLNSIQSRIDKVMFYNSKFEGNLDELRGRIIKYIPHELRTPLHAVIGFSEIIREEATKNNLSRVGDLATYIHEAGIKLLELTNRYTRFIEVQTSKKESLPVTIVEHPKAIIEDIVKKIAGNYMREEDLILNVADLPIVVSDEKLRIVVSEIADNAFKFSKKGEHVLLNAKRDSYFYCLTFTDAGRGMSMENIRNIGAFQQFEREKFEQQGSGLGLVTSKLIVELYDGSFSIDSSPEDGTKITIRLLMHEKEQS